VKILAILLSLSLALLAGCTDSQDDAAVADANRATTGDDQPAAEAAHGDPHGGESGQATAAPAVSGEVLETMDAASYTYVKLQTADGELWAAGPQTPVQVGETIELGQGMLMPDFHSTELDRTFDEIWFVGGFAKAGGAQMDAVSRELQNAHAGLGQKVDESIDVSRAEGGQTVAGIYELDAGDAVLVRGKVVKANYDIMGSNWYHIQDGTGSGASADITVTSQARVNVGDVVLVEGELSLDRDFGAGYRYDRIVEDAELTDDTL